MRNSQATEKTLLVLHIAHVNAAILYIVLSLFFPDEGASDLSPALAWVLAGIAMAFAVAALPIGFSAVRANGWSLEYGRARCLSPEGLAAGAPGYFAAAFRRFLIACVLAESAAICGFVICFLRWNPVAGYAAWGIGFMALLLLAIPHVQIVQTHRAIAK